MNSKTDRLNAGQLSGEAVSGCGFAEIDAESGQCVIYSRSDSTLNRGGVRMGTSEFYQVVESLPEILGSLVIDTTGLGRLPLARRMLAQRSRPPLRAIEGIPAPA